MSGGQKNQATRAGQRQDGHPTQLAADGDDRSGSEGWSGQTSARDSMSGGGFYGSRQATNDQFFENHLGVRVVDIYSDEDAVRVVIQRTRSTTSTWRIRSAWPGWRNR